MANPSILKGGVPTAKQIAFAQHFVLVTGTDVWLEKVTRASAKDSARIKDAVVTAETMKDLPADVQAILTEAAREAGIDTGGW